MPHFPQRSPVCPTSKLRAFTLALIWLATAALAPVAALGSGGALAAERADPPANLATNGRALLVATDGVARNQVVAIGRDLIVEGTVFGNASVLTGNARVSGSIGGDLIVLEGSVLLLDGAHVKGDVVALGGEIEVQGRARVDGRSLAYPNASRALLALVEMPSLGGRPVLLSSKLGVLLAWWLAGALLVSSFSRAMLTTSEQVNHRPLANFFLGLTFLLSGALGFLLLSAFAPSLLSLPLVVLFVLLAFVLKIWGTVAVLLALGRGIGERVRKGPKDALGQFLLGLAILGSIKLIPWFGTVMWSAVTMVGLGAAFRAARPPESSLG